MTETVLVIKLDPSVQQLIEMLAGRKRARSASGARAASPPRARKLPKLTTVTLSTHYCTKDFPTLKSLPLEKRGTLFVAKQPKAGDDVFVEVKDGFVQVSVQMASQVWVHVTFEDNRSIPVRPSLVYTENTEVKEEGAKVVVVALTNVEDLA